MINQSWIEIKDTIQEIINQDSLHIIKHLLPIVELLESKEIKPRMHKNISMFCLNCHAVVGNQALDFPFVSLMPPGELYSGTSDDFLLSVYDRASNGEERQLIREKYVSAEVEVIVTRLIELVHEIEKGDRHL